MGAGIFYLIITFIFIYCGGFVFDFLCEVRMRTLFVRKQEALKGVHQKGYSMAVVHAKVFKIEMDYLAVISLIEKKRKYIRILLGFRSRGLLSK